MERRGALAQDEFDMAALETSGPKLNVDLSQFSQPGSQLPGRYHVDVYVNHEQVDAQTLDFVQDKHGQLTPVVTPALLAQWGIKIGDIDALRNKNSINDLAATVPDSQIRLDYSQMRLDLTIPQADVNSAAQDSVSPTLWDEGVPALLLGYDFNGSNTWRDENDSGREDSYFLNLHSGINLGAWRLETTAPGPTANRRNITTPQAAKTLAAAGAAKATGAPSTPFKRDVQAVQGLLTLGDATTPSDVYDGFTFRGVQLSSDDDMLPDSLRNLRQRYMALQPATRRSPFARIIA